MNLLNSSDAITRLSLIFQSFELNVPDEEIRRLASILTITELKKGEFFVRSGESKSQFGFISKGLVRFYYNTHDGKEFNQTFHKENDFIMTYYTIMSGMPSVFNIQALESTIIYTGEFGALERFYEMHPIWNKISRKFYDHNYIRKTQREAELLIYDATTRYELFCKQCPDLLERLSQHHIALYLGINPVSLNRIIKRG